MYQDCKLGHLIIETSTLESSRSNVIREDYREKNAAVASIRMGNIYISMTYSRVENGFNCEIWYVYEISCHQIL